METEKIINWLNLFTEKIVAHKAYLNDLDTAIGDGDHGSNMARGTTEMMSAIETKSPSTPVDVFKLAAMTLISKVGGASGPLYGSAFMGIAKSLSETDDLVSVLQGGMADIEKRGKSTVNEKTMLDVWGPVIEALKTGSLNVEQVEAFAEKTKNIKATKGRASYLGDRSLGHLDPGAVSSSYFFEAMLEAGVI